MMRQRPARKGSHKKSKQGRSGRDCRWPGKGMVRMVHVRLGWRVAWPGRHSGLCGSRPAAKAADAGVSLRGSVGDGQMVMIWRVDGERSSKRPVRRPSVVPVAVVANQGSGTGCPSEPGQAGGLESQSWYRPRGPGRRGG